MLDKLQTFFIQKTDRTESSANIGRAYGGGLRLGKPRRAAPSGFLYHLYFFSP
jgi:hypothetical protein